MNKVILVGRIGRDPETKYTTSGKQITNFSLATSEYYNGEQQTEWHSCVLFGSSGVIQYLAKGVEVAIDGKIQTRSWEAEGKKNYRTEIIVFKAELCGGKRAPRQEPKHDRSSEEFDDDIPF